MDAKDPIGALKAALEAEAIPFRSAEPLSRHTTFRIGGPAAVFCEPDTVAELARALELCRALGVRVYLLGNGSNTLFADEGFDGMVLSTLALQTRRVTVEDSRVFAGAGASLRSLCTAAQAHGLAGLEFAYGIPGSVGGAVYMNAGAYGGEIKTVLCQASFLDETGALRTLPAADLQLGYRTSIFEKQPWCILEAVFALQPGDPSAIAAKMADLLGRRKEKQPLDVPSAGSTFKRPQGAYAGQLIEQCGLRGFRVGGAQVSEKHCGFVVNADNATCADVVSLTDQVRRMVKEKTGFTLEREIRVVK